MKIFVSDAYLFGKLVHLLLLGFGHQVLQRSFPLDAVTSDLSDSILLMARGASWKQQRQLWHSPCSARTQCG